MTKEKLAEKLDSDFQNCHDLLKELIQNQKDALTYAETFLRTFQDKKKLKQMRQKHEKLEKTASLYCAGFKQTLDVLKSE
jgi:hypothetical protein